MFKTIILRDLSKPVRERHSKYTGPYRWTPAKPGSGRGFYLVDGGTDTRDSPFRLRIEVGEKGWYTSEYQDETMNPVIARLPRSRGFLSGWTLGEGMASSLAPDIHETEEDAWHAAGEEARIAAEHEREYRAQQSREIEAQELRDETIALTRQVRVLHAERRQFLKRLGDALPASYAALRRTISTMLRTIEHNTVRLQELEG